jgi:DNA-binding response OmpR family regulator
MRWPEALAAGCNAYVTKPYSPRALLAKVRDSVDGKQRAMSEIGPRQTDIRGRSRQVRLARIAVIASHRDYMKPGLRGRY